MRLARVHRAREVEIRQGGYRQSREVHEAQAALLRAQEEARHARGALDLLGADPESHGSTLRLLAPISGVVAERPVARGEQVEAGAEIMRIVDTSNLWLWLDLYEKDQVEVRQGMAVQVQVSAFPDRVFRGRISFISPTLDPDTRTVRARVEVPNLDGMLNPQMFASVEILQGDPVETVTVPESALQDVEGREVVYVAVGPQDFERRPVVIGVRAGGLVEVREGLKAGERVAVEGAFTLKSEDRKEAMGEGHAD